MATNRWHVEQIAGVTYTPADDRACITGTGVEVYQVVHSYEMLGRDWQRVRELYHWLAEDQVRAALAFYDANRAFVDDRIAADYVVDVESLWRKYPETRPKAPADAFLPR